MSTSPEKNKNSKGLFITFEGIEGAGKSTNIEYIAKKIKATGQDIVLTREPGGTALSEAIRELLISKDFPEMHINTELLLMFAARAEHIDKVITPAINAGKWVLCDRFTDATFAYQGGGRGISEKTISLLEQLVQLPLKPDYTFLFDIKAEIGLARAQNRGETDRFHIDFFNRVRNKYLSLADNDKQRFRIVDAEPDLPNVQKQIDSLLAAIL